MKIPSNQEIVVTYIVDGQERFVETRNFDHLREIKKALTDFGFKLLD